MAGLKHKVATLQSALSNLSYRLRNIVSGSKPVHVVVCGPDDRSAQAVMGRLPQLFSARDITVVWGQALWAKNIRSRVIVSWDPDDASRAEAISSELSLTRRVVFVLTVADPRELVCERSPHLPHHFHQGADYRLHVDGRTRSMTEPGALSRSRDVLGIIAQENLTSILVRREDLHTAPDRVDREVARVVRELGGPAVTSQQSDVATETGEPPADLHCMAAETSRLDGQRARFPDLDEVAVSLQYEPLPEVKPGALVTPRGLIIAFHTPDEVYQAEADRLRKSLDALGLDYQISVVEPESNWVRTTLLKPTWIAPARKKLRGPLLYVDVDAYVHSDPWPYVADLDADMAAVVYKDGQLNSATLWVNDTQEANSLLELWAEGSGSRRESDQGTLRQTGDDGDQGVLQMIVEAEEARAVRRFRFGRLTPNLAAIFDRTEHYRFGPLVIEQLQVSREVTRRSKRLSRRHDRLKELSD